MNIFKELKKYLNDYHPVYKKNYIEVIVHCIIIPVIVVLIANLF